MLTLILSLILSPPMSVPSTKIELNNQILFVRLKLEITCIQTIERVGMSYA
jgi:hypothetical protein